jgi:hypothetical protein
MALDRKTPARPKAVRDALEWVLSTGGVVKMSMGNVNVGVNRQTFEGKQLIHQELIQSVKHSPRPLDAFLEATDELKRIVGAP